MQVRHILREKGREIVALESSATLLEASRLLARRKIGALIVRDAKGRLAGIFSERDLVRAIAERGADALSDTLARFMTEAVATCTEADSVDALMEMMTIGRFRHLPVTDGDGALCGVVSIGDVVKTRISETVGEAQSLRDYISAAV